MLTKYINHLPREISDRTLTQMLNDNAWKITKATEIIPGDVIVDDFSSHYVLSVTSEDDGIHIMMPHDGFKRLYTSDLLRIIPKDTVTKYLDL